MRKALNKGWSFKQIDPIQRLKLNARGSKQVVKIQTKLSVYSPIENHNYNARLRRSRFMSMKAKRQTKAWNICQMARDNKGTNESECSRRELEDSSNSKSKKSYVSLKSGAKKVIFWRLSFKALYFTLLNPQRTSGGWNPDFYTHFFDLRTSLRCRSKVFFASRFCQ